MALGEYEGAQEEIRKAQVVDPLSPAVNATAALVHYFGRANHEAIEQSEVTIDLHPGFAQGHFYLGLAFEQLGEYDKALTELGSAKVLSAGAPEMVAGTGHVYARMGERHEAENVLAELESLAKDKFVSSYLRAKIFGALGEADEAFAALERAVEERTDCLVFVKVDPCMDCLRGDVRFDGLLQRLKLT